MQADPSILIDALEHLGWQPKALDDGPHRYGFGPRDLTNAQRIAGGLIVAGYSPSTERAFVVAAGTDRWWLSENLTAAEFDEGVAAMRARAASWEAGFAAVASAGGTA